jgi:TolA-binding protein
MGEAVYNAETPVKDPEQPGNVPSVRDLAMQWGWVPQEEYKGDPEKFVDYAEFVQAEREVTKSLKKHISTQERKIDTLNKAIKEIKGHYEQSTKEQQKDILKQLEAQWHEAVEEGDTTRAKELQDRLFELKSGGKKTESPPAAEEEDRAIFQEWQSDNPWFGQDEDKTIYAEGLFATFQKNGEYTKPLDEILEIISGKVAKKFDGKAAKGGDEDRNASTAMNADVGTGRPSGSGRKSRFTYNDLTERQKKICRDYVRDGTFKSNQEYVDSLVEAGGLS